MWCKLEFSKAKKSKTKPSLCNFGTDGLVNVQIGSVIANKSFELEQ